MGFTHYEILREFQGGLVVWWFGGLDYSIINHGLSPHDFSWKPDRKEELEVFY